MSANRVVAALALSFIVASSTGAAEIPKTIDAANVASVGDVLLPAVRKWVERGDFTLATGALRFEPRWDDDFAAASQKNTGRYDVDPAGNVVERESGRAPTYVFGFPFPDVDPKDPRAGLKILWNRWYAVYKRTQVVVPSHIHIVGREGLVRDVEALTETMAYDGREGGALANPEGTEYREIVRQIAPSYVEGITTLTWRFRDQRWDTLWVYTPISRRVRQATSANRSDAIAGSDVTLDDALVWAGKNQSFDWKLEGAAEILVPAMSLDPQPLHAGARWQGGTEWVTGADFTGVRWGYEVSEAKGAPWQPTNVTWVPRPVWVVEGRPRDRYYSYGRQLFYVDRDTFVVYAKAIDTPAGDPWKTVLADLGMACAPERERCYSVVAMSMFVDDRNDRATVTSVAGPGSVVRVNTPTIRPESFTVQGLLKKGK